MIDTDDIENSLLDRRCREILAYRMEKVWSGYVDLDECGVDEIIMEGHDYLGLREEMYEKGYVLYNRVHDDGRLYFVRERVLIELLEGLKEHVGGPLTSIHHHMDHDMISGLERLLDDPLGYEWCWKDFRNIDYIQHYLE